MRKYFLFFVLFISALNADEQSTHKNIPLTFTPWFTGPLLAPSGYTAAPKNWNMEPYLFCTVYTGKYDEDWKSHNMPNFYSVSIQVQAKVGIVKGLDFQFYPQVFYNTNQGQHYGGIGDLPIGLNIQVVRSKLEDPWPALKLSLKANIPIGKYQHLNERLKKTDAIGAGSWLPALQMVFSKLWNTWGIHFLESRLAINYQIGTGVHVKGLNVYGGGHGTKGTAYPGNALTVDGAIQYNFNQRWVFACDLFYVHTNKNRFSGKTIFKETAPSSESWSVAPALEYNWSKNVGVIAGSWVTFAGRNSYRFVSGVAAVNVFF